MVIATLVQRELADPASPVAGRDPPRSSRSSSRAAGPSDCSTLLLRVGPYGDGFGADPTGWLDVLERTPTASTSARSRRACRTCSHPVAADRARARADPRRRAASRPPSRAAERRHGADRPPPPALQQLVDAQPAGAGQGPDRCTLQVHPDDAARLGLSTAGARWCARRPGPSRRPSRSPTTSCPAWSRSPTAGDTTPGMRMGVARAHAGVNSNVLTDESVVEPLSGNAVLNGIPVGLVPPALRWAEAWFTCRVRGFTLAVSDMRAIVEWAPQLGTPSAARSGGGRRRSGSGRPGGPAQPGLAAGRADGTEIDSLLVAHGHRGGGTLAGQPESRSRWPRSHAAPVHGAPLPAGWTSSRSSAPVAAPYRSRPSLTLSPPGGGPLPGNERRSDHAQPLLPGQLDVSADVGRQRPHPALELSRGKCRIQVTLLQGRSSWRR